MAGWHITADVLRAALDYDPLSGIFRWKADPSCHIKQGMIAGCLHHRGYWQIRFLRQSLLAHRLAWLHFYGEHPSKQIDHINGCKSDNRIANLRDVSPSVNLQNYRGATSRNKSTGLLGVYFEEGRFRARIAIDGKNVSLGRFPTAELAYAAYVQAKRKMHEGNTL
jgi:hypothetical protein